MAGKGDTQIFGHVHMMYWFNEACVIGVPTLKQRDTFGNRTFAVWAFGMELFAKVK